MGSIGSMLESGGFSVPSQWETVDYINGIKVVRPKDSKKSLSLPSCSNTPGTKYILLDKNGTFKQLKKYGKNRIQKYDIDFGKHNNMLSLHIHYYDKDGHKLEGAYPVPKKLLKKYRKVFKNVPKEYLKRKGKK